MVSPIGAALMRWHPQESELIYIAMMEEHRGQGHGKAVMNQLLTLARQRRVKSLVVGTANSSSDNILFYQKCGFRIDSVRKNYFNYFESPVYEHGIEIRDMLVFRSRNRIMNFSRLAGVVMSANRTIYPVQLPYEAVQARIDSLLSLC